MELLLFMCYIGINKWIYNIVLLARTETEQDELVEWANVAAQECGIRVNAGKTEVMKVCDDQTTVRVTVKGVALREVNSFKYLEAMFNSDARCDEDVHNRLSMATERLGKLGPLWRRQVISSGIKARLIQALVWLLMSYRSEAWTLNQEVRGNIKAFEMHINKKSIQIQYTDHVTNDAVLKIMGH